jgi:hypothetical protein
VRLEFGEDESDSLGMELPPIIQYRDPNKGFLVQEQTEELGYEGSATAVAAGRGVRYFKASLRACKKDGNLEMLSDHHYIMNVRVVDQSVSG